MLSGEKGIMPDEAQADICSQYDGQGILMFLTVASSILILVLMSKIEVSTS